MSHLRVVKFALEIGEACSTPSRLEGPLGAWKGLFMSQGMVPWGTGIAHSYAERVGRLREMVLFGPGTLDSNTRRAAAEGPAPAVLATYVNKVRQHAYKVTDEDVAALRQAGYSEDQIFELTVSASLGAGLRRLEAALAAIRGGT